MKKTYCEKKFKLITSYELQELKKSKQWDDYEVYNLILLNPRKNEVGADNKFRYILND